MSRDTPTHVVFVLARAVTYATCFIGFVLVFLPAQVLSWSGISQPEAIGAPQVAGMVTTTVGTGLALWCVFTFVFVGLGTPAPFDPPRRLVAQGPYRVVRNPMYIGAGLALAGAALFSESAALLGFTGLFLVVTHAFVVGYEEPTLRHMFGQEYEIYTRKVRRWRPGL